MNQVRKFAVIMLALLLVASLGCKSRTVEEEPVVDPVVVEEPEPAVVEVTPEPDFVPEEEPETIEEQMLRMSLAELNATAHERGFIRDAFFEFDAFALTPEARDALAISASWLKLNPEYRLVIEGHADERGTEQYNLALGERRAFSAFEYLAALGIPESRMRTISYGEERPFDRGTGERAWARNRRAHLVLER